MSRKPLFWLDKVIKRNGDVTTLGYQIDKLELNEKGLELFGWIAPVIGTVKDTIENGVYHKRVGRVDLGSLNWTYWSAYNSFYSAELVDIKTLGVIYLNGYTYMDASSTSTISSSPNKSVGYRNINGMYNAVIKNTSYTDASAFKTAMSGIYLYYELATEQTKPIF